MLPLTLKLIACSRVIKVERLWVEKLRVEGSAALRLTVNVLLEIASLVAAIRGLHIAPP